jgi:hypothetical protein
VRGSVHGRLFQTLVSRQLSIGRARGWGWPGVLNGGTEEAQV